MQPHVFPGDKPIGLCPLGYFRDNPEMEYKAFSLHMNWERGILPVPGGLDDQPVGYMAVITATETGVKSGQARVQEVQMKKAERQNRGGDRQKRRPARS